MNCYIAGSADQFFEGFSLIVITKANLAWHLFFLLLLSIFTLHDIQQYKPLNHCPFYHATIINLYSCHAIPNQNHILFMLGSKINQLNQSSFRERASKLVKSSGFRARVASVLLRSDGKEVEGDNLTQQLRDYIINLPPCAYHHQPIKYLCLCPTCPSSNYSLCDHPHCKTLHSNPDTDLIELESFNQFVGNNCSSLLMISKRVQAYLVEFRQRLTVEIDKAIQKTTYIFQNIYMGDIPKIIRQKSYKDITSAKLFHFVKHQSFQNNIQQRLQMQNLGNQVTARISELNSNFDKLINSKPFQSLALIDIIKVTQSSSPFTIMGKIDIHKFESQILQYKQDFQDIFKMLKENRAPSFTNISTIFRASEHEFLAEQFHKATDAKSPLLILVRTTLSRKFGAFLNCKINQKQQWIPDATGLSFIFSLDKKECYKLKSEAKYRLKAVYGGYQGPQIGSGCDLYLVDKCNTKKESGANLGGSYRLPAYLEYNTPKSRSYLANEQSFFVEEYEVFLLQ